MQKKYFILNPKLAYVQFFHEFEKRSIKVFTNYWVIFGPVSFHWSRFLIYMHNYFNSDIIYAKMYCILNPELACVQFFQEFEKQSNQSLHILFSRIWGQIISLRLIFNTGKIDLIVTDNLCKRKTVFWIRNWPMYKFSGNSKSNQIEVFTYYWVIFGPVLFHWSRF